MRHIFPKQDCLSNIPEQNSRHLLLAAVNVQLGVKAFYPQNVPVIQADNARLVARKVGKWDLPVRNQAQVFFAARDIHYLQIDIW